jgi:aminodeoxyfutalosine deaminase
MEIFSAAWVIPVTTPVIGDGSVVIDNGRIIEAGSRADILNKYYGIEERRFDSVLMPGLVNTHMHLELSHLSAIEPPPVECGFTAWISELMRLRQNEAAGRTQVIRAFSKVLGDQYASGVALVADIGNEFFPELYGHNSDDWPEILRMIECLAPNRQALVAAKQKITDLADCYPACVHAPYSSSSDLLLFTKKRCRQLGHLFAIHTAEFLAELEFLRCGTGCFRDFLEARKVWDGTFTFTEQGFDGTIFYFDHLGILDEKTLLVHAVHVAEMELKLIAERGGHICLCPGSNRFLRVGKAPLEQMFAAGILPALGTDSPASNQVIDLWREMQLLAAEHPQVAHRSILAMATLGGAQALHRAEDFGSLTPGRRSQILHVSSPVLTHCNNSQQVMQELVTGGRPSEISWISTHH